ncbi:MULTISPECIES: serine hydrolase [unclassified Streptomyces]|uniref:D-alanyl-D-alanine carboxypeptidase family protein n=1 Tax=unclassified Streptomyces TaxID=2593676 RepID=UPI0011C71A69|nr:MULTISPECIES: serine hydrolase [unclassified Streptomyces]TXL91933.1 D-alanyl-D-alanine carboxypeptidase [Streptomyces sp. IB2014 016-6]
MLTGTALVAPTTMAAESAPTAAAALPTLSAKGAFLLDDTTGAKRYGKNADIRRQMASTTKIMTAAVVLNTKGIDLNRQVTIKQTYRDYVVREGASTADLRTGDKVTIRQLLYGLMLPSGCDAAYALADAIGTGSTVAARTKSFISKMNAKATELGLKNTKFDSFDGISQAGDNYTTPRDLATIADYAMNSSTLRTVVKATSYKTTATTSTGGTRTYTWYNTNQLLGSYSGAFGVKTGTGTAAGPCLIFAATRNGKTHIGVILNGTDRYTDAAKLLDYYSGASAAKTMKLRQLPAGAERD